MLCISQGKLENAKWKKYKKEIILHFAFYNFHFVMPSVARDILIAQKTGGLTG